MIKIVVDCFGGDKSPDANIHGALKALEKLPDLHVILTGDEKIISEKLKAQKYDGERLEIIHAPEVISCDEKPTDAIRLKRNSSMMAGIKLLREDPSISGMVSTGSSGAYVAAAIFRIGRLKNVSRPAFCPVMPTMDGGVVGICDSGANIDCKPEMLYQFALMGSEYIRNVYGKDNPRVALLNVGTEAEKGDDLRKEVYSMLSDCEKINFIGNIEGRDLLSGKADLVVCDGFSGNVLIKSTEGTAVELLKKLKTDIFSKLRYKIGAALMSDMFKKEKDFMNYQNYGGSILLGCNKIIVKGHGSANAVNVCKCIEQAYKTECSSLNSKLETILE